MAFVALSNTTKDAITGKLKQMRIASMRNIGASPLPNNAVIDKDALADFLWGEHKELREKLPNAWKATSIPYMHFYIIDTEGNAISTVYNLESVSRYQAYCGEVSYPDNMLPPNVLKLGRYDELIVPASVFGITEDTLQKHDEWFKSMTEEIVKWQTVANQVSDFLDRCKSLNQALKLMPSFRMYIPAELLARVDEKVERSAPKGKDGGNPLEGLDVNAIAMAALTARAMSNN